MATRTRRRLRQTVKICYLGSAASIHTRRWASHFAAQGHEVEIVSFEPADAELDHRVTVHFIKKRFPKSIECFLRAPQVKKLLAGRQPDIVHAHYASSYGTLGRLCRCRPYVLSVWGSDVYEFPNRSPLHRELLKLNLSMADQLCSTSDVMAGEIRKYCNRPITITPFGIDCEQFRPVGQRHAEEVEFVVGTVKTLEPVYGIECLIRAFALFKQRYVGKSKLRFVIAGEGYLKDQLQTLADNLQVARETEFVGSIPHSEVPALLGRFSVFANLSKSESFGVAPLEASACGLPVLATNVGNLPSIVRDGATGLIVPSGDVAAAADALLALAQNSEMRKTLGSAGREFVVANYSWPVMARRMELLYNSLLCRRN